MTRTRWIIGGAAVVAAGFISAAVVSASPDSPGEPSAEEFIANLPDRVPVMAPGSDDIVGTAAKEDLYPASDEPSKTPPRREPVEVLDDHGVLVGHMYPGIGFVSLQVSQAPGFDPQHLQMPTTTVVGTVPVTLR